MLFKLGKVVGTPAALELLRRHGKTPDEYLDRHVDCDWGDVDREDDLANFQAIKDGARILSSYRVTEADRIWVITESDRSSTCILLPGEY